MMNDVHEANSRLLKPLAGVEPFKEIYIAGAGNPVARLGAAAVLNARRKRLLV